MLVKYVLTNRIILDDMHVHVDSKPKKKANFCPLPCPEVAPEFDVPVSPWLGSGSDGSPCGAVGEAPLGGWPYRS